MQSAVSKAGTAARAVGMSLTSASLRKATSSNSVAVLGTLIPHTWLRDHCRHTLSRPVVGQRTFDTATMSRDIAPSHVDVRSGELVLRWPDAQATTYSLDWLKQNYVDAVKLAPLKHANAVHQFHGLGRTLPGYTEQRPFNRASFPRADDLPGMSHAELVRDGDKGLLKWMRLTIQHGFSVLRDTPATFEATSDALRRLGYFESSIWGTAWEFTADLSRNDMAYGNDHLHVHNDATYMPMAAYLEALHCLSFDGPRWATNTLVDGIAAAERISDESRDVLLRYLSAGRNFDETTSQISHDTVLKCDAHEPGRIVQVRYNNEDRDTLCLSPDHTVQFYDALLEFSAQLRAPESEVALTLRPGLLLVINNWRTLHGRSAFLGKRQMCGAYHTLASIFGTARALAFKAVTSSSQ